MCIRDRGYRVKLKTAKPVQIVLRTAGAGIAVYGLYAFFKNQFLSYMFLTSSFVFFDFERPALLFFTEYAAIMGLFVFLAYDVTKATQRRNGKKKAAERR